MDKTKSVTKFKRSGAQDEALKAKMLGVLNDDSKSYHEILMYIQNEINESTRTIAFSYSIKCFLEDGAFALSRAVEQVNGFTTQQSKGSPSREVPPTMLDVKFADGSHIKVPWGTIDLPSFGEDAYIDMGYNADTMELILQGQCERRYNTLMDEIVDHTRRVLDTDSIYRGRAIKITAPGISPEFIDLSDVDKTPMFLTKAAKYETQPIEARIEHTAECLKNNIDIRFGVLLEGNYGGGKTLYAFKLASKAIINGWTFLYCPKPEQARYVMEVANMLSKNGKGVVIFLEDIDKVLSTRNSATNEISLLMDGGETKTKNVITILTTNHLEKIDPTFLRGKRIGSIVTLGSLDKEAAQAMIEHTLRDEEGNSILEEPCDAAALAMEESQIVPAFVAEILERVKSHRIFSRKPTVNCEDILHSIASYKKQMSIAIVKQQKHSPAERLISAINDVFPPHVPGDEAIEVIKYLKNRGL